MHANAYPVGRFELTTPIADDQIPSLIESIRTLPIRLDELVSTGSAGKLAASYREGGWTGIQVIHHLADSHMNAFMRFKLALTEDSPTIRPYNHDAWAETADNVPVCDASLMILRGVHTRWSTLLDSMPPGDFDRTFHHPQQARDFPLRTALALYAWHGRHHVEHVRLCLNG